MRERGFTLLEVLIAFIIAALALGVLYEGIGTGLLQARVATHTEGALSRARSRLAAFDDPAQLVPGQRTGDDGGGYRYRVQVSRLLDAPFAGPDTRATAPRAALFGIRVTVGWSMDGDERQVSLGTERFGTVQPFGP